MANRGLQAVIFDLDGLLVDSEPVWFRVRTEMFGRFGLEWTDDDQRALMGRSTATWIEYVDRKLEGRLQAREIERETLNAMVSQYRTGNVALMPGAQEALEYCAARFAVGLGSGSPRELIDAAIDANQWSGLFRFVLSSDTVPHGKPAPDVYEAVMKKLCVASASTVVVEDSGSGILAGKAAGAAVIAVPNTQLMPPPEALQKADVIIPSLSSIGHAIEMIGHK
jgi:HAD superfamily hydrolase (TIGR01509 family)